MLCVSEGLILRTILVSMKNLKDRPFAQLGRNIAKLRDSKGISQGELAFCAGVSISTLKDIERGVREGHIVTRKTIADYFAVPLAYLYSEEVKIENRESANENQLLKDAVKHINLLLEENNILKKRLSSLRKKQRANSVQKKKLTKSKKKKRSRK